MFELECRIEQLRCETETVCTLSIPSSCTANAVVLFAALHLEKSSQIRFIDRCSKHTLLIARSSNEFSLLLDGKAFPVTKTWLESIASLLTDAALNGWFAAAHIDADFDNGHESVSVCIKIEPPV